MRSNRTRHSGGNAARWMAAVCVGLLYLAVGCSEPDRSVTGHTDDDAFSLTLTAQKNWLKPGESLPVRIEVKSLSGRPLEARRDTVELVANNGTVVPNRLFFSFVGVGDSLSTEAEPTYADWVTFSLSSYATAKRQGEIHALFRDLQATLKIRIVTD